MSPNPTRDHAGRPGQWWTRAACRGMDTDLFYPERGKPAKAAQRICAGCPVRRWCLADALQHRDHHGVWGGASKRQRRKVSQLLRAPARATASAAESRKRAA